MNPPAILLADDQRDVLQAIALLLKPEGYRLVRAHSPAEVLAALEKAQILGGVPFSRLAPGTGEHEDLLLVATTERIRREDLDRYLDVLKGF